MNDRTKLLVHINRMRTVFSDAIRNGPDGSLEGKFEAEHPTFVNHSLGFYLAGCLAYLEGEDGARSWRQPSPIHPDFDTFAAAYPHPPRDSFLSRGISTASLDALFCIRNAVTHNDGDLSKNHDTNCVLKVGSANISGVTLNGSIVTLEAEFLEFVCISTLAVRSYYGEG